MISIVVGVHIYTDRDKVIQPDVKESDTKWNKYPPKQWSLELSLKTPSSNYLVYANI